MGCVIKGEQKMSVTYGFYNSHDGDRVYDAEQFSSFLDGIVYDGVYASVGNKFYVTADGSSLQLMVDTGRAWFNHTWTLNDGLLYLDASDADLNQDRIDAVIIEVNKERRENLIKIIEGTPSENPNRPTMTRSDTINQYAIAYITRPAASTVIIQDNITYVVGDSETPLCSALALAGIPSGGRIGQVLAKSSNVSGAVGWYDPDKLPYNMWYLCDGITEYNVLAAYKFIRRTDELAALKNINEKTEYILTKNSDSITWNTDTGIYIPSGATSTSPIGLLCASLLEQRENIKTVIIKYSNADNGKTCLLCGGLGPNGDTGIFARTPYATESYTYLGSGNPGFILNRNNEGRTRIMNRAVPAGIISATFNYSDNSFTFYMNGQLESLTSPSGLTMHAQPDIGSVIGTKMKTHNYNEAVSPNNWATYGSFRVQYALFLNCELNASQHYAIFSQITSDAAQSSLEN